MKWLIKKIHAGGCRHCCGRRHFFFVSLVVCSHQGLVSYDLKLDGLALELNGADFLQTKIDKNRGGCG